MLEITADEQRYVFVNLHLNSKIGDEGLYSLAEDPQPKSSARRHAQAKALVTELERRFDPSATRIILLGDFNDHADADALKPFRESAFGFRFRRDSRGEPFTFSHEFSGLRGAIDHIVTSGTIPENRVKAFYLNLNADKLDQASDHNPVLAVIR